MVYTNTLYLAGFSYVAGKYLMKVNFYPVRLFAALMLLDSVLLVLLFVILNIAHSLGA